LLERTKHGTSLPIWSSAHPVAVLRRPKNYEGRQVVVADFPNKTYYKPEGNSLFFVGSLDPAVDEKRILTDNCPSNVDFDILNRFAEAASSRIPKMKHGTLHSSYYGMYDMSPDQHPIIDELSSIGLGNVFCCVGLSGHGFKLCPALGLMVGELVGEKESTKFDSSCFSLSRFSNGNLLKSKYATIATIA
jgi:sarcosine oxidase, subunit beta